MIDQGVVQSTQLVFKDDESVYQLAEKHERLLLIYDEKVYDVTEFADRHPGGYDIIEHYSGQDITDEFHDPSIHRHSKQALNQLMQYQIGKIDDEEFQVMNKQKEVLTQYFIDFGEFTIDRAKPLLNQLEKLNEDQFHQLKPQEFVYYPFSENPKNFIQFEDQIQQEKKLWIERQKLSYLELFFGLLGILIQIIYNRSILIIWIAIISLFIDYNKILRCFTFSKRSTQFRFIQTIFPIKSHVTKYQCLAELGLIIFYLIPYVNIYATVQLIYQGLRHLQYYKQLDSEFLRSK